MNNLNLWAGIIIGLLVLIGIPLWWMVIAHRLTKADKELDKTIFDEEEAEKIFQPEFVVNVGPPPAVPVELIKKVTPREQAMAEAQRRVHGV